MSKLRVAHPESFFRVPNYVARVYGRALGPVGVAVYAALAVHADAKTGRAYPSASKIAGMIGAGRTAVAGALRMLVALDLIRPSGKWKRGVIVYELVAPIYGTGVPTCAESEQVAAMTCAEGDTSPALRANTNKTQWTRPKEQDPRVPETADGATWCEKDSADENEVEGANDVAATVNQMLIEYEEFYAVCPKMPDGSGEEMYVGFLAWVERNPDEREQRALLGIARAFNEVVDYSEDAIDAQAILEISLEDHIKFLATCPGYENIQILATGEVVR